MVFYLNASGPYRDWTVPTLLVNVLAICNWLDFPSWFLFHQLSKEVAGLNMNFPLQVNIKYTYHQAQWANWFSQLKWCEYNSPERLSIVLTDSPMTLCVPLKKCGNIPGIIRRVIYEIPHFFSSTRRVCTRSTRHWKVCKYTRSLLTITQKHSLKCLLLTLTVSRRSSVFQEK